MLSAVALAVMLSLFMFFIAWMVQLITDNAAIGDVIWPLSILSTAWIMLEDRIPAFGDTTNASACVILVVTVWALRLSVYLYYDRFYKRSEEGRYKALRSEWGENFQKNIAKFYGAQIVLNIFLSVPFFLLATEEKYTPFATIIAYLALSFLCILGESAADFQLKKFKKNPKNIGKVCRVGLWNISRHPNYFFEWLYWITLGVLATIATGNWLSLLAPILITFSLFKVTGIPATEDQAVKSRGYEYVKYQEEVGMFFPKINFQKILSKINKLRGVDPRD